MALKLYSVSDDYCNYLRQYDSKVFDNKEEIRTHTRKYVGVVLDINGFKYYVPMSSPKRSDYYDDKKEKIRPSVKTIIRMTAEDKNGNKILRGTLKLSNMIPVDEKDLTSYDVNQETDKNYQLIVRDELDFLSSSRNTEQLINNAMLVYSQKAQKIENINYLQSCVDYQLLEEKCKEYNFKEVEKEVPTSSEFTNNQIKDLLNLKASIMQRPELRLVASLKSSEDCFNCEFSTVTEEILLHTSSGILAKSYNDFVKEYDYTTFDITETASKDVEEDINISITIDDINYDNSNDDYEM